METKDERAVSEMNLLTLAQRCAEEMSKYRRKEVNDDRYCLEILRRATVLNDANAWGVLYEQFRDSLYLWFRRHPHHEAALQYGQETHYVDDAFERFWKAVRNQKLTFTTVAAAFSYLHLCMNCAVMDALRDFARPKETPLPDYDQADELGPLVEDLYHEDDLWRTIESLLPSARERRVAYLHFHCNLKPREIMRFCPGEFINESEIYHLKRNVIERLMRNKDKFLWRLGGR